MHLSIKTGFKLNTIYAFCSGFEFCLFSPRGLNEGSGWVKLITDASTGEILGAHLIGPQVTELLPELTLAANAELTIEEIARNVHAHPSLSEALMEAAHGLAGGYIHA